MGGFLNYFGYDILYYVGDPDTNNKIEEEFGAVYKQ